MHDSNAPVDAELSLTVSEDLERQVLYWHEQVRLAEPGISVVIRESVPEGGALGKFESRIKSLDSFSRKVRKSMLNFVRQDEEAFERRDFAPLLETIEDALRYTVVAAAHANIPRVASDLLASAHERSIATVKLVDSFQPESRYKGLHANLRSKADDWFVFEVQFHSDVTLDADAATHQAYEEYRASGQPLLRRQQLHDAIAEKYAEVPDIGELDAPFALLVEARAYKRPR